MYITEVKEGTWGINGDGNNVRGKINVYKECNNFKGAIQSGAQSIFC